jgi:aryl-alcohol dehydrogenase-like predicted oxidoreductase
MDYRLLGDTGVFVSEICLGAMPFGGNTELWKTIGGLEQQAVDRIVHRAIDHGVNFIDTADVYAAGESETMVGRAIGSRRSSLVIATKVRGRMGRGPNQVGLSRLHVVEAVNASLARLWLAIRCRQRPAEGQRETMKLSVSRLDPCLEWAA